MMANRKGIRAVKVTRYNIMLIVIIVEHESVTSTVKDLRVYFFNSCMSRYIQPQS